MQWMDVLRVVAWPIGEEEELALWAEVLQWAPGFAMVFSAAAAVVLFRATPPRFPDTLEELGENGALAWDHFCGDVTLAKPGAQCLYFQVVPGVVIAVTFALAALFRAMNSAAAKRNSNQIS